MSTTFLDTQAALTQAADWLTEALADPALAEDGVEAARDFVDRAILLLEEYAFDLVEVGTDPVWGGPCYEQRPVCQQTAAALDELKQVAGPLYGAGLPTPAEIAALCQPLRDFIGARFTEQLQGERDYLDSLADEPF